MRRYPAGVTIVTMQTDTGPMGFTATSFASISLTPPLISFNISHVSSCIDAIYQAETVVIHFLGEHQRHLAERFARSAEERFSDPSLWRALPTEEPVLHGTPLWLRVKIQKLIPIGDHTLVVGLVLRVHQDMDDPAPAPLLYHEGGYFRPQELPPTT
ncbi:MAG: flavin reductase family protein [Nocardiaceae bacterium]|nr:flavin reductase family protein [Nocardiaceae bacterium]